jgi:CRISPR/Cas system-associated endoribonuclease Cas2
MGRKIAVYDITEEERDKSLKASEKYPHDWINSITKDGLDGE